MTTTWSEVSARLGRNDLPEALAMNVLVYGTLTDSDEIAKGIAHAWTSAEWPGRYMEGQMWKMLWEYAVEIGEEFLNDDGERVSTDTLPVTITLYRGCTPDYRAGMSWTTDRKRAEWFANRLAVAVGEGTVYQLEAPAEWVLARFDGRGEAEYVLDPEMLDTFEHDIVEARV